MSGHPEIGEILYAAPERKSPMQVIAIHGTMLGLVPLDTNVRTTHKGNLYDANGKQKYRDL